MLTCPRCGSSAIQYGFAAPQPTETYAYWVGYLSETLSLVLQAPTLDIAYETARNALAACHNRPARRLCISCGEQFSEGGAPCAS